MVVVVGRGASRGVKEEEEEEEEGGPFVIGYIGAY